MRHKGIVIGMILCLLVCSCTEDRQREPIVKYDRDSVLEMLASVSDTTMVLLEDIDQSGLSPTEKYALVKTAFNLLQRQNVAYALLCEGELNQALKAVEEVRLLTVKTQVELDYSKKRLSSSKPKENSSNRRLLLSTPVGRDGKSLRLGGGEYRGKHMYHP